ncbi:hypothetical protein Scep_008609 [Stephania cephalantha]|uniref:RRM domain-containing protein n=1 Tax=Stephania cephalantha TaxID=152367 RepID=A0AAP0KEM7_9MAGN
MGLSSTCSQIPSTGLSLSKLCVVQRPIAISLKVSSLPSKLCFKALQLHRYCASPDSSSEASMSPSTRIFIKGLSQRTTEGVIAKAFSQYGKVNKVKIVRERRSGESLGFAYVWFDCEESAEIATEEMDGKFFGGRFVAVTIARPETPTSQARAAPYKF